MLDNQAFYLQVLDVMTAQLLLGAQEDFASWQFAFPHMINDIEKESTSVRTSTVFSFFGPLLWFMFLKLKIFLKMYSFWISWRCKQFKDCTVLKGHLKNNFQQCFQAHRHWNICNKSGGEYFGADNHDLWLVRLCFYF
jgi:hypothetical protein